MTNVLLPFSITIMSEGDRVRLHNSTEHLVCSAVVCFHVNLTIAEIVSTFVQICTSCLYFKHVSDIMPVSLAFSVCGEGGQSMRCCSRLGVYR